MVGNLADADAASRPRGRARYARVERLVPNYPLRRGGQGYVGHPALADPAFAKAALDVFLTEALALVSDLVDGRRFPSQARSPLFLVPPFRTNFWRGLTTAAIVGGALVTVAAVRRRRAAGA